MTFPFSSVSLQQCYEILNILKRQFDNDETYFLGKFIIKNLSDEKLLFSHHSGRPASALNKGQLMKIALELKALIKLKPELNFPQWMAFDLAILNYEGEKWTKKLEDYESWRRRGESYDSGQEGQDVIEIELDGDDRNNDDDNNEEDANHNNNRVHQREEGKKEEDEEDEETMMAGMLSMGKFRNK